MIKQKILLLNDCNVKFAGSGEDAAFSGYASTFGGIDSYDDRILPGAYAKIIAAVAIGKARMPRMFVNHSRHEIPVGKWTSMAEDKSGLQMTGEFTPGNPDAAKVRAALKHETIDGLSIGYGLMESDFTFTKEGGRTIREIKNVSLLDEVSIVTFPADSNARVNLASVKSELTQLKTLADVERLLRDAAGFSKSDATALVSRVRAIATRSDSETIDLPDDVRELIKMNLLMSNSL